MQRRKGTTRVGPRQFAQTASVKYAAVAGWRPKMDRDLDALLGFAPDYDAPIPYMRRTREYYAAIGYTTPYRWAHHVEAPFTRLRKPLREARLTIITTAAPYR